MNTTANEENIPADKAGLFDLKNIDHAPLDQLLTTCTHLSPFFF